jgi:hypothetical protein
LRLIRQSCAILVIDNALGAHPRGRKWTLDPVWLFRQVYVKDRACHALAAETRRPVRSVVEVIRRLSARLQGRLLAALALPDDVVAAIMARVPVHEVARENIRETLRAFVADEDTSSAAPRL